MGASGGAEFEPFAGGVERLAVGGRRSRARDRLGMAAWAGALVGVVLAAGAGRLVASGPEPRSAAIEFALPSVRAVPPTAQPAAVAAPFAEVIVLSSPLAANDEITTRDLLVQGYLRAGAGTIRVTLEARGNRVIDELAIEPVPLPTDGPRLIRLPRFEARFGLPNPRPNGRMIVQVIAFGQDGRVLDVIRRPILIGPILDGPDTPAAGRTGQDASHRIRENLGQVPT